jgi:hypothetical protein
MEVRAYGWQPLCHHRADYLENVGTPTSHNPMGLHACYREKFTFFISEISEEKLTCFLKIRRKAFTVSETYLYSHCPDNLPMVALLFLSSPHRNYL